MNDGKQKVLEDLIARDLSIVAFICENAEGNVVVLAYEKGLLSYISPPCPLGVNVNERADGSAFRPLISFVKPPIPQEEK